MRAFRCALRFFLTVGVAGCGGDSEERPGEVEQKRIFYVSPEGDDACDGLDATPSQGEPCHGPFRTPARALEAVAQVRAGGGEDANRDLCIWLRKGTYVLDAPLPVRHDTDATQWLYASTAPATGTDTTLRLEAIASSALELSRGFLTNAEVQAFNNFG